MRKLELSIICPGGFIPTNARWSFHVGFERLSALMLQMYSRKCWLRSNWIVYHHCIDIPYYYWLLVIDLKIYIIWYPRSSNFWYFKSIELGRETKHNSTNMDSTIVKKFIGESGDSTFQRHCQIASYTWINDG